MEYLKECLRECNNNMKRLNDVSQNEYGKSRRGLWGGGCKATESGIASPHVNVGYPGSNPGSVSILRKHNA